MKNVFFPIFAAYMMFLEEKSVFELVDSKVEVEAPIELLKDLSVWCNGKWSMEYILEQVSVSWERDSLVALFGHLIEAGVVIDARKQHSSLWKLVQNPALFPVHVTEKDVEGLVLQARERHLHEERSGDRVFHVPPSLMVDALDARKSVRLFSGEKICIMTLSSMLWCAYGETGLLRRTVPSAGALYPLDIHLVLLEGDDALAAGVYKISFGADRSVYFSEIHSDVLEVFRAFIDPLVLDRANGVIVVTGSFDISAEKYGNRGLLYTALEAGHVAQNIHLSAQEFSVATLEVGGFIDAMLTKALRLGGSSSPLVSIVFGTEQENQSDVGSIHDQFCVDWAIPFAGTYFPGFLIASAKISPDREWSHGRDRDPKIALIKAISEAKEWGSCGCIPPLVSSSFEALPSAIDPREVIVFHEDQYKQSSFPFGVFDSTTEYQWTKGYEFFTHESVFILADHVYFPFFPDTPYHCYANSSGCAAYPDRQIAVQTAILELVERDSFMSTYLLGLSLPKVDVSSLPEELQGRVEALQAQGFEVYVIDTSLDLAPVATIFAQSDDLSFTTCAAASRFSPVQAISHALQEVEASVLSRLSNGVTRVIDPDDVIWPLDHGALYAQSAYYRRSNFMFASREEVRVEHFGKGVAASFEELIQRIYQKDYAVYLIDLELSAKFGGNGDLSICRAIIPGLVPMTFGAGQVPGGVQRLYQLGERYGCKKYSFEDLIMFPHPFE